ncbi:response regulator [Hymenobacter properus]|uniref:Response regulator n=1 Tax=Hymenobacter properus TaxID=2791026 RepID=A0A931BLM6_9BACT|nr:response regulator [Hymenobacter properus]MBF9143647.1 response regulator [Hymenobacter properus]MBR7722460.1 response regulator [Microvirga sp. SRT04]
MPKLTSVLLVDDDPTNNFLNERLLKRLDVAENIVVAANGQDALAVLQQASQGAQPSYPSLILLDIQMPIMNGIEFLQAFQHLSPAQRHATTVVVLTTSMDARDLNRLDGLPAAGCINKPLTAEKVDTLLQLHYQRQRPC